VFKIEVFILAQILLSEIRFVVVSFMMPYDWILGKCKVNQSR